MNFCFVKLILTDKGFSEMQCGVKGKKETYSQALESDWVAKFPWASSCSFTKSIRWYSTHGVVGMIARIFHWRGRCLVIILTTTTSVITEIDLPNYEQNCNWRK